MKKDRLVQVGVITGARGIRGEVWISSFTADPAAVAAYGPLLDAGGGQPLRVRVLQASPDGRVAARIEGVADRNQAEALKGRALYVPRPAFPEPAEDEFYHADLIGLRAVDPAGSEVGAVVAVHNHGAGDVIEIAPAEGPNFMLPFSREAVPRIDVAAGEIGIVVPDGWLDQTAPADEAAREMADADGGAPAAPRPAPRRPRGGSGRGLRGGRR